VKHFQNTKGARFASSLIIYITNHVVSRIVFSWPRLLWYKRVLNFSIGHTSSILTDFRVSQRGNVEIGTNCIINNACRFDNRNQITIGNNVSISYGTILLSKGHDIDDPLFRTKGAPIRIDDYVWICAKAIILPGVTIGKGAVILTGSVVTKDVEPFAVVGGNPAKFIRKRSETLLYTLKWNPWVPFFG